MFFLEEKLYTVLMSLMSHWDWFLALYGWIQVREHSQKFWFKKKSHVSIETQSQVEQDFIYPGSFFFMGLGAFLLVNYFELILYVTSVSVVFSFMNAFIAYPKSILLEKDQPFDSPIGFVEYKKQMISSYCLNEIYCSQIRADIQPCNNLELAGETNLFKPRINLYKTHRIYGLYQYLTYNMLYTQQYRDVLEID